MADQDQTVVSPSNAPAEPDQQKTGAQDDVDALLAQFGDQSGTTEPDQQKAEPTSNVQTEDVASVAARLTAMEQRQIEADVTKAAETIADGTVLTVKEAERFLDSDAREDPRLLAAFNARNSNPSEWQKVLKAYNKKLKDRFGARPDEAVTEDVDAVESAVRSAATKTPTPGPEPDWGTMDTNTFREQYTKRYGTPPPI